MDNITKELTTEMPKITIVTPSYNQGQYLEQTIRSVLEQGYPNLEYIIIDGASTDNSVEIIKQYANKLAYWESCPDTGQSSAINKGLKRAKGDIVSWLNSDDLLLPGALLKIGQFFLQNPMAQVITGYTVRTDENLRILFNHYIPVQTNWFALRDIMYISQQSTFWKKDLLDKFGYIDESLHVNMDLDLWLRFLRAGIKITHKRHYIAVWRLHPDCKSMKYAEMRDQEAKILRNRYKICNGTEVLFGRITYRMLKLLNGDYLKDILFRLKWQGHPLSQFTKSI
jgi:glycosyltransferase involved in cell wall biosynthesis